MMCLTCQFKMGTQEEMSEVAQGVYVCEVCKTTKCNAHAAPVLLSRAGIAGVLMGLRGIIFVGGFTFLLLATMLFTAHPTLEAPLTWTMLFSLYLLYFGMATANLRARVYA